MMNPPAPSNPDRSEFLKPFWAGRLGPPWLVSLFLLVLVAAARFFAVLNPLPSQLIFLLQNAAMWAVPFILFTSAGRHGMGLQERGITARSITYSALAGAFCALTLFVLGMVLYGDSPDNWCISLRDYLHLIEMRGVLPPVAVFALFAVPATVFAPIGDEILFRGFIQRAFTLRWNPLFATLLNCLAFGLIYLYFHAIWQDADGFHLRLVSGALQTVLLAGTGLVFTLCRHLSGSLWPAVAAHAAFNLTILAAAIFYYMR